MNLLEKCQSANAKIAELVEAKQSKEVQKRVTDLSDASDLLIDYSGRATVLLDAGILKPDDLIDHSKLAHQLGEMRQKLSEDPSTITVGRNFTNLKRRLKSLRSKQKKWSLINGNNTSRKLHQKSTISC